MEKNFTRADFLPEFFENVLVVEGMWAMLFSTLDDDDEDAFVAKVREGKFSVGTLVAILVPSNSADLLGCREIVLDVTLRIESSSFVEGVD